MIGSGDVFTIVARSGSDNPVPRLSHVIKREYDAKRSRIAATPGISQGCSTLDTNPGTKIRSNDPSPMIW